MDGRERKPKKKERSRRRGRQASVHAGRGVSCKRTTGRRLRERKREKRRPKKEQEEEEGGGGKELKTHSWDEEGKFCRISAVAWCTISFASYLETRERKEENKKKSRNHSKN